MSADFITTLIGIVFGLLGLSALLWAWSQRQLRGADAARYAVRDDEPDYTGPAPAAAWSRRVSAVVLVTVFMAILLSPLVTIVAAMSAGMNASAGATSSAGGSSSAGGGSSAGAPAAKCPFSFGK